MDFFGLLYLILASIERVRAARMVSLDQLRLVKKKKVDYFLHYIILT